MAKKPSIKDLEKRVVSCKLDVDLIKAELARCEAKYNALLQYYARSPPPFPRPIDIATSTEDNVTSSETSDAIAKPNGGIPPANHRSQPQDTDSDDETFSQSTSSSSSRQRARQLHRQATDNDEETSSQSTSRSSSSEQRTRQPPARAINSDEETSSRRTSSSTSEQEPRPGSLKQAADSDEETLSRRTSSPEQNARPLSLEQAKDGAEEASSQDTPLSSPGRNGEQLSNEQATSSDEGTSSQSTSSCSSGQEIIQLSRKTLASEAPSRCSSDSSELSKSPLPKEKSPRNYRPKSRAQPVKWTDPIIKRPSKTSAPTRDTSSDSEESISSEQSIGETFPEEESPNDVEKKLSGGNATGVPASLQYNIEDWASEAKPQELFEWKILGFWGPWSARSSPGLLADSSWAQRRAGNSAPLMFSSVTEYRTYFEHLVIEECKATLWASWEALKSRDSEAELKGVGIPGVLENSTQPNLWDINEMLSKPQDPFYFYEAEAVQPASETYDASDLLLLTYNDTTALAVVHLTDYKRILLSTLTKVQVTKGQVTLVLLCKMLPIQRQYISLAKTSEIWGPLLRQILQPQENTTGVIPSVADSNDDDLNIDSRDETILTWSQKEIFNKRQLITLKSLLQLKQGFMLVQGPPGTGKTSAIVGMISAALIYEPRIRILVCATSNVAIDEVVSRLMSAMLRKDGSTHVPERGKLVRVGVKQSVHPACLPVYIDNVHDRNRTIGRRTDTLNEASIVCSTISSCGNQFFDEANRKFDLLIVDEAAQVQEAELLIALRRVRGRCIMVGDPCQLPAVVVQKPGEAFRRSLFERMQEAGVPVIMMTTQYRMHPQISKFPSDNFYRGLLRDSAHCLTRHHIFKDSADTQEVSLLGNRFELAPYVFVDVPWGMEQGEQFSHSIANEQEAEVVAAVIQAVVQSLREGVNPNIGVITPYLAQRAVISRKLECQNLEEDSYEVNTVDGFQGREKDVIIVSCVRAQSDKGIGFVSDKRRINVALTRARYCLIIVGHSQTLRRRSNVWHDLITDASERGSYQLLHGKESQVERPTTREQSSRPSRATVLTTSEVQQRRNDLGLEQGLTVNGRQAHQTASAEFDTGYASSTSTGQNVEAKVVENLHHQQVKSVQEDQNMKSPDAVPSGLRCQNEIAQNEQNFQHRQPEHGQGAPAEADKSSSRDDSEHAQRVPIQGRHHVQATNSEIRQEDQDKNSPSATSGGTRDNNDGPVIELNFQHRQPEQWQNSPAGADQRSIRHDVDQAELAQIDYRHSSQVANSKGRWESQTRMSPHPRLESGERTQQQQRGQSRNSGADHRSWRTPTSIEGNNPHRGSNSAERPYNPSPRAYQPYLAHGGEGLRSNSTPARGEERRGERRSWDEGSGGASGKRWVRVEEASWSPKRQRYD